MTRRTAILRSRWILAPAAVGALAFTLANITARPATAGARAPRQALASTLSTKDMQTVQAAGYLISTRAGTRVSAVKAPGAQVWDTYYKGIDVGPDTATIRSHDLIVVRSTSNIPGSLRHDRPGEKPSPIGVAIIVIDSVTGRVVAYSTAPPTHMSYHDNAALGRTLTDLAITNVAPPR